MKMLGPSGPYGPTHLPDRYKRRFVKATELRELAKQMRVKRMYWLIRDMIKPGSSAC